MHRPSSRAMARAFATSALTTLATFGATSAHAQSALPTGGSVVQGSATIATDGTTTTVTQASDRAVVNWTGFDVAQGKAVVFAQPGASSATLNRVTGAAGSTIAGSITSNGAVYLVNPNGIAITATGTVQTGGGFVASTLGISDADFMAGTLNFTGTGASAIVKNRGAITAGAGGYVALLGGTVNDSGTITVPLGRVGLASGESVALDLNGDGFLRVAVPTASIAAGSNALIEMTGQIAAAGGRVMISAASARDAVRNIVNVPGSISADSATGSGGSIVLLGGDGGTTRVSGTLTARATGASGNGGFVETSGAHVDFAGLKVDTSAAHGATGTWLVDPTDLTVDQPAAFTISNNLAASNVTLQTNADGTTSGPGSTSPGAGNINVNGTILWTSANTLTLNAYNNIALNGGIISLTNAGGLTLNAGNGVAYTGTISAPAAVQVATFTLANGNWSQTSRDTSPFGGGNDFSAVDFRVDVTKATFLRVSGGSGTIASPYTIYDVYGLQGMASVNQLASRFVPAAAIDASGTGVWNGGRGFVAIGTDGAGNVWDGTAFSTSGNYAGFSGGFDGAGLAITGLAINRTSNYQGLFGYTTGSITNTVLTGGSVRDGSYSYTGSLIGYAGAGATISGDTSSARVAVTGNYVGGLIGYSQVSVSNSSASGTVDGANYVGGLIGWTAQSGTSVTGSSATGDVTATSNYAGGLIAYNYAAVSTSFATGNVTGSYAGGLIGLHTGSAAIDQTYATGAVTSTLNYAGGLIGQVNTTGTISRSYATGAVSQSVSRTGRLGALIGRLQSGSVTQSYATGAVSGGTLNGGLVGTLQPSGSLASSVYYDTYSTGLGTAVGQNNGSGIVAVAVTSDPAQSGAANYAFKTSAYANFTPADWVFFDGQTRPFGAWEAVAPGGALTNAHQFQLIGRGDAAALAGSYTLGRAIDLAETGRVVAGTPASYAGMWAATGFVSIGTDGLGDVWNGTAFTSDGTTGFTGSLNGRGLTVGNLAINRTGAGYQGLVGYTSGNAALSNIGLTNAKITAMNSSGALLGYGGGSTQLSNAYSTGTVTGNTTVGGLVGFLQSGTIANSYSTANVSGSFSVGGLVGSDYGATSGSYATGTVTGSGAYVGGLVGESSTAAFTNVYATGNVTGASDYIGGLIGYMNGGSVTSGRAAGTVTASAAATAYIGGLVGRTTGTVASSTASGAVTGNASDYVGGLIGYTSAAVSGSSTSGAVSGQNYAGGLIGYTTVAVSGSSASGNVSGAFYVGGLIGRSGPVTGSSATGNVTASDQYAGGLIGWTNAAVSTSFATGSATGSTYVGGLIGYTSGTAANVNQTYATGAVSATLASGASYAGGLIGYNANGITISRSYATGAVGANSASARLGGLIGASRATITQSYATGAIGTTTYRGGLIGDLLAGGVAASDFFDSYSTGVSFAIGSTLGSGAGSNDAAVTVTSNPTQSGSANYAYKTSAYTGTGGLTAADWVFFDGQTRPFGAWEVPAVGSALTNAHQVQLIGANATTLAGSFTLGGNINLAETGANTGAAATSAGMWSQLGFVPLGSDGTGGLWNGNAYVPVAYYQVGNPGVAAGFSGSLIGGGFTLSNLGINRAGIQNVGLFGGSSGTIRNVTVTGNVTGYISVGGVVGLMQGGTISGVTSAVNVSGGYGSAYVGGLVGFASGAAIAASSASGTVSADGAAGGLVGLLYNSTLTNSTSSATVTGRAGKSGSVVGIVERSTATGNTSTGTTNGTAGTPYGALRDGGTYN